MPPRLPLVSPFGTSTLCFRQKVPLATSTSSSSVSVAKISARVERQRYRDPYILAQVRQRRAANQKKQEQLKQQRESTLGDPVRGVLTPFVESFDHVPPLPNMTSSVAGDNDFEKLAEAIRDSSFNYYLSPDEVKQALENSNLLTKPIISSNRDVEDPARDAESLRQHSENHTRAVMAMGRIISLANGNRKDRTRVNIRRCVETFGRHNTDKVLKPKTPSNSPQPEGIVSRSEKIRAGPDTGSPEVQVAILTAKIRNLADHLEQKGRQKDKMNKRNLRILVHKRQKLLSYLQRKERGGERWQNLIQTLGLTESTWKGEISL